MVFESVSIQAINKEISGLGFPSIESASDSLSQECYGAPAHRTIAVIYNPAGGSFHQKDLDEFASTCRSAGADVVTMPTERAPNSASSKAIAAADSKKYDTIVSWGGDGTFSGVENGLHLCLDEGKTVPPVAVYPGGTENVFAKTMHSPHDPDQFAQMVLSPDRTVKNADVMKISYTDQDGKLRKQDIIAEVGVGPLATAIDRASSPLKKILGPGYLGFYFLKAVMHAHPKRYQIDTSGDDAHFSRSSSAFLVNTGGPKFEEVTPKCNPFDGKVDVVNLPKASFFDFLKFGIAKHHHRLAESHLYEYGQLDNPAKIVSSDGKPFIFDADGERRGPTKEIDVSVQPHLIPVVVDEAVNRRHQK